LCFDEVRVYHVVDVDLLVHFVVSWFLGFVVLGLFLILCL